MVMPCPEELMQPFGVWAGEVLLPSCLAMVATSEGEIRGFVNLLHDIHHVLSGEGVLNHMEIALETMRKCYWY